jgi:tetratricopeptide (TPR) repeat protein
MRVNVQLIDAESGSHLWAERFDKPLADLFDMQDEIVARLAGALNTELVAAEARRSERTPTPDSMDLYFQGMAWYNRGLSRDNVAQARSFFDRALSVDPDNVDALVSSARADSAAAALLVADPVATFAAAEAKVARALSRVQDHARGHACLGHIKIYTKRAREGIANCEHALRLDRNLSQAHGSIGFGKVFIGRPEETQAHIVEALRLSPRDILAYLWMSHASIAKNHLGLYEQAVAWCRRAIEANRDFAHPYFVSGGALARLGRLDEARSAVRAGRLLNPAFTLSSARSLWTAMSSEPAYLATVEPVLEAMRMARAPEE